MLLALIGSAWPCAGLIVPEITGTADVASSDAQQAYFRVSPGEVSVEYRVRYSGNAADFAWIIPVPGEVVAVEEGSEETFTAAEAATAPQVLTYHWSDTGGGGGGGCGCMGAKSGGLGGDGRNFDSGGAQDVDVTIKGTGYAGAFEYTILSAENADGMLKWLEDNGYDTTISGGVITSYVEDPTGFEWVAVKLAPTEPTTPEGGVALDPLRIRYAKEGGAPILFPARMGSAALVPELRNEIFVFSSGWAQPEGEWTGAENSGGGGDSGGFDLDASSVEDAATVYEDLLRSNGSNHRLWPAWAGSYTDPVTGAAGTLSRWDTITPPATSDADMIFVDTGNAQVRLGTEIGVYEASAAGAVLAGPLSLLAMLVAKRRRKS